MSPKAICPEKRAYIMYLRNESKKSFAKIAKQCKVSKSSCHRICQPKKTCTTKKKKMGRPRKVDERSTRKLIRCLQSLGDKRVAFTVKPLVAESGLSLNMASRRTFSRILNENGYGYFQRRKKGLLSEKDRKIRKNFGHKIKKELKRNSNFWKNEVAFYLDGVSFVHKYNPMSNAASSNSKVWRKRGEGLKFTAKGSKELPGGRRVHALVAVSYGKGVILNEPYTKMDGQFFANFIRKKFNLCFGKAGPKHGGRRLFVMDNCPCQTSKVAMASLGQVEAEMLKIPARSPDINPIENIFHLVKSQLNKQAVTENITSESYEQFQTRVLQVLRTFPVDIIDKTIDSMSKRINKMISSKGYRTKY